MGEQNRAPGSAAALEVLQQFRVIYGTMRRHFRLVEERCGLSGVQMWVLQEVARLPGLGVTELAGRLGVHQSSCSLMVERLVGRGVLVKKKPRGDGRRVGLFLSEAGVGALAALPGAAEGVLPAALAGLPEVVIKTLKINLDELIHHLPGSDGGLAEIPLSDMVNDDFVETGRGE